MLVLEAASRRFGGDYALRPCSLELDPGAVAVVEGANGSGKTTLLRVAAGVITPTSGRRECGGSALYLRPGAGGRSSQSVEDAVGFVARVAALRSGAGTRDERTQEALHVSGLAALRRRRVGTLSSGQRSRLLAALVVAARPTVVCLDEPFAHLDADGAACVTAAVRSAVSAGTSVLLAVHDAESLGWAWAARLRLCSGTLGVV